MHYYPFSFPSKTSHFYLLRRCQRAPPCPRRLGGSGSSRRGAGLVQRVQPRIAGVVCHQVFLRGCLYVWGHVSSRVCVFLCVCLLFMKGSLRSFLHTDCWGEDLYLEVLDGAKKSL